MYKNYSAPIRLQKIKEALANAHLSNQLAENLRLSIENNITLVNIKYDQDDEDLNKLKEIINESMQKNKFKGITLEKWF